jgi:predicted dehydrogenase
VTLTALAHGCHVLGEKPMADSLADAARMVAAAQAAGKIYAVTQNRRYDARVRRFQAFLRAGTLGPLTTLHSDFYIGAHFGGFREQMRHVLLLDMAIHTFDAARLLSGADPVAVYCQEWNPTGSWYDHHASAMAIFEMTDNIVYTYRGSWCAEGLNTAWEAEWRALGTRGSAQWDGADDLRAATVTGREGLLAASASVAVPEIDPGPKVGGHAGLLREFVACVETGATPETSGADNIRSLAMVFAAIQSAETGRRVAVHW